VRVYTITKPYTVLYDAAGKPFAQGQSRKQDIPADTRFSPAECQAVPKNIWRWGLDD
jgi:hypothetical protein